MYTILLALVLLLAQFSRSQDSSAHHQQSGHRMIHKSEAVHLQSGDDTDTGLDDMGSMHDRHTMTAASEEWMFMTHGNIFFRYTHQGGKRGSGQLSIPNWLMSSAQRYIGGNGSIEFRSMVSIDRLTDGGDGYPLLLQSGETWNGKPLVDRQHPHDLIAGISATYRHSFDDETGGALSLGYPGEPAVGPPAFMHRPAAQFNPDAPIGHHWQDATHISFGVATAGIFLGSLQLEGSVFTGREPDENRYNFDRPRFDSYSGRVVYIPGNDISLQLSYGFLKNPEGHGDDVNRISASFLYSQTVTASAIVHVSAVYGQNIEHHQTLRSYLLEMLYLVGDIGVYGRHESVEKPRFDLGIILDKEKKELVHQITAGINTRIAKYAGRNVRVGVQGAIAVVTTFLEPLYGKNPMSYQIYLQMQ